jgi:hypothetical protein
VEAFIRTSTPEEAFRTPRLMDVIKSDPGETPKVVFQVTTSHIKDSASQHPSISNSGQAAPPGVDDDSDGDQDWLDPPSPEMLNLPLDRPRRTRFVVDPGMGDGKLVQEYFRGVINQISLPYYDSGEGLEPRKTKAKEKSPLYYLKDRVSILFVH